MQRWHLTLGLSASALVAVFLAPRLFGAAGTAPPAPLPTPPMVEPHDLLPPPVQEGLPLGHLRVDAGLDRTAVLEGADNERYLTVTVSAPANLGDASRRPVDLSVVMDVSGSMAARGKIDQARRAAKALAGQMGPTDTWSLVVFNDDATVVIPAGRVSDLGAVERAIDRIYEGGGTNLYAGMDRGANEIRRSADDGAVSRVVVLSDGNANIGVTDPGALARYAAGLSADGISVSTVGMGLDYNEDVLGRIADLGGGSYHFVNTGDSLEQVFAQELATTASVVGQRTLVHVELPPDVAPVEIIGWDAQRSGNGWDVFVGDVYSGETKKIVARVRVHPNTGCASESCGVDLGVASVDATYQDVPDGRAAHTPGAARARVTTSRAVVTTSVDRANASAANRAVGSWYLDQSTRAYERGDQAQSAALAAEGSKVLRSAAIEFDAPELLQDADLVEVNAAPMAAFRPDSEEGKIQTKKNKELFRDLSR